MDLAQHAVQQALHQPKMPKVVCACPEHDLQHYKTLRHGALVGTGSGTADLDKVLQQRLLPCGRQLSCGC